MEKLNETLTIPEIEEGEHEARWQFRTFEELEQAQKYTKEKDGVLYTQVDSEISDDRIYVKGNRLVNRTGTWAVVTEPNPMAFAILQIMKQHYEQLIPTDFPLKCGELERQYRLSQKFLEELEKLYLDCAYCQRRVAPNEQSCETNDEYSCLECFDEGT